MALALVLLMTAACSSGSGSGDGQTAPKNCTTVDVASSPEKVELFTDLARRFNASPAAKEGGCSFVRVLRKSSGEAMQLLADGWPDEANNGTRPVIWSPASSAWGAILNQKLSVAGQRAQAPASQPFMRTPLVIAMPRPMAEALGWPNTQIGYADILKL